MDGTAPIGFLGGDGADSAKYVGSADADLVAIANNGGAVRTGGPGDSGLNTTAVDLGFRIVIVEDALCSSLDAGHDALMTLYRNRFSEQIDVVDLDQLKELWRARTRP